MNCLYHEYQRSNNCQTQFPRVATMVSGSTWLVTI